ncbi:MAG: D-2-hydroxyacid dehydrogenase [Clostridia bacterium]|nr:D-2-hydroxyacid dehydrogenase [Clostridia bacterium]
MKAVILDGFTTNPGDLSWKWLEEKCELTVYDRTPAEKIVERCEGCDIVITNKTPLTKETLARLPECKFIALLSTGYNVVDHEYAATRSIPVSNIPTYSTAAVAQLTFALLLELTNKVATHNAAVKNGEWSSCADFCFWKTPLQELFGKTMGIIGFGKIGQTVANIAHAFGMKTVAYTANPDKYKDAQNVEFASLDTLLEKSDVVSLHCPLTEKTQGMVNADFLGKMKKTAYLINTSRGPVLDEKAVAKALKNGEIAGAGVDVLSTEPPKADNPLLGCENCIITPHIAWAGFETRERLLGVLKENIFAFLDSKPINTVNM